ncbi:hypothetical protein BCR44DRAFT_95177 [Catenaria anguillulae PL171]|uniref:Uncharacterized protein n=1 Tax=Catenaria anguillulae PL171 TaxID=765915 RepID=A0A1Y2H723_9FUNG|nr:hypothetical protein BCR44DRAFT_95177 [Catenaria anguillulae PL171]
MSTCTPQPQPQPQPKATHRLQSIFVPPLNSGPILDPNRIDSGTPNSTSKFPIAASELTPHHSHRHPWCPRAALPPSSTPCHSHRHHSRHLPPLRRHRHAYQYQHQHQHQYRPHRLLSGQPAPSLDYVLVKHTSKMFATAVVASSGAAGAGAGIGSSSSGAMAVAMARSKQAHAAASSTFKPIRTMGGGGLAVGGRATVGGAPARAIEPTMSVPQPQLNVLKSPLNRLASRPASELIGARQFRSSSKPLTISTHNPIFANPGIDDVDDDSSLISLLFSPTTPTEQSTTIVASATRKQQQQRTLPIRILPRTVSTSPTRTPPSPSLSATRRALPPRFPLRPADVKAEFIILNTVAAVTLPSDSGIDPSSASASDQDAMLSEPELATAGHHAVTAQPPMVTSFKSIVKAESGLTDAADRAKLKRPRVKYLRKPKVQEGSDKAKRTRAKKGADEAGFYSPLRARVKLQGDLDQCARDEASSTCSSPRDSNQPLESFPLPCTTVNDKGKGKAKVKVKVTASNSRKRRRSDSFVVAADSASDGNDASREASPDHPADADEARSSAGGPVKVRKIAKGHK